MNKKQYAAPILKIVAIKRCSSLLQSSKSGIHGELGFNAKPFEEPKT